MALMDCYRSLSIDPMYLKSHFRLAKCLHELKWIREASECIEMFVRRFPDYADTPVCEKLIAEIRASMNKLNVEKKKPTSSSGGQKATTNTSSSILSSLFNYGQTKNEQQARKTKETTKKSKKRDDDEDNNKEAPPLAYVCHGAYSLEEASEASESEEHDTSGDDDDDDDDDDESERSSKKKKRYDKASRLKSSARKRARHLIAMYDEWKSRPVDLKRRYCGHCNVATDIKEANFIGEYALLLTCNLVYPIAISTKRKKTKTIIYNFSKFICAGSDDGSFFIWNKTSTNVVRVLKGDESIVNCIQPHPLTAMIATSGIDHHVRVWTPKRPTLSDDGCPGDDGGTNDNGQDKRDKKQRRTTQRRYSDDEELDSDDRESRVVRDIKSAVINNQEQLNSHPLEFLFLDFVTHTQSAYIRIYIFFSSQSFPTVKI